MKSLFVIALFCFALSLSIRLSDAQGFDLSDFLHKKEEPTPPPPPAPKKKYEYHSHIDHGWHNEDDDEHWGRPKYKPSYQHEDNWWWTTTTTTPKPTTKKSIIPKELSDIVNGENMDFVNNLMPSIAGVGA